MISIMSAGPSILSMSKDDFANIRAESSVVIAINDALNHFSDGDVDWYSAGDWNSYMDYFAKKKPRIGWLSLKPDRDRILTMPGWGPPLQNMHWRELEMMGHIGSPSYSVSAAIALAYHLADEPISLFGHDMAVGHAGSSGPAGGVYSDARFRKERQELDDCLLFLKNHNRKITIHHRMNP